jgi:hypothetical protein
MAAGLVAPAWMVDQVRLDFSSDCKAICHVGLVAFCKDYKSNLTQ